MAQPYLYFDLENVFYCMIVKFIFTLKLDSWQKR